jgi:CRP/FNR family transcriptional regulator, cyclic AMP receptor protein
MISQIFSNEFLQDTDMKDFRENEIIMKENDESNETMYFILSGTCSVFKSQGEKEILINELSQGEFFGEIALISNQNRSATVKVKSETAKILLFSKKKFINQTISNPVLMFSILKATIVRFLKADYNFETVISTIPNLNLDIYQKLSQNPLKLVNIRALNYIHSLPILSFSNDFKIFSEGKEANQYMYFIIKGNVSLFKEVKKKKIELSKLELGNFFGEVSFISDTQYSYSAITTSDDVKIVPIDKVAFLKIVNLYPEFLFNNLKNVIWKLINTEKASFKLKDKFQKTEPTSDLKDLVENEFVIREGDSSNETMYFILEGNFSVCKNRGNSLEEVNVLKQGDFFGELSLISNQPRTASIQVKSNKGKLLLISKEKFLQKTKENPNLVYSILKATIARLVRAENKIDKIIKSIPELDPSLAVRFHESRLDNLNVFNYVHNLHTKLGFKGDRVYTEGERSDGAIYFILEGSVAVIKKYNKRNLKIANFEKGDFFGETALVSDSNRTQSIMVSSEKGKIIRIDKYIFDKIIHINPGFLFSLLRNVIWKLIFSEKALYKLNMTVDDLYERKY